MKKIILFSFVIFSLTLFVNTFISCSKSSSSYGVATISFKAGDSSYSWNGDLTNTNFAGAGISLDSIITPGRYTYVLVAIGNSGSTQLDLYFILPYGTKINTGTYTDSASPNPTAYCDLEQGGALSGFTGGSYHITATINSANSYEVDGTFSGTVGNKSSPVVISNGVFKNVKIH